MLHPAVYNSVYNITLTATSEKPLAPKKTQTPRHRSTRAYIRIILPFYIPTQLYSIILYIRTVYNLKTFKSCI